jgi:hypothetical protein
LLATFSLAACCAAPQNIGTFGAVFVASMEVIENLAKFRLAAAAKGLVSLTNRKAELLKWEANSPANEINFLIRAKNTFGLP